jgi:predicted HAD superfamily Cof-like phosphohydrolase
MSLTITPDQHHTFLSSQAKEFRSTYRVRNSISRESRSRQKDLIVEEFKEFLEADGQMFRHGHQPKAECLKELADLVYVCYQYAENQNWDLDEALHRVHESNMSKLDEDGQPIFRKDGKVLKGPNYAPPNLEDLV